MITNRISLCLALSLSTIAACGVTSTDEPTDPYAEKITALEAPTEEVIDYTANLETCDPELRPTLQSFIDGASVRPEPSTACGGHRELENLRAASCFSRYWANMGYTERAACIAVGLPICWTIFCSGIV